MHRKAGRWLLVVALATAPSVGCKSGASFPLWNPFAKPTPTPGSSMLQSDGDGGYLQAPQPQMAPPEPRAEEFGWTAPFKKFGDTISSPFKKSASAKPKPIVAEDDPISLTSKQAPAGAKLFISLAQVQAQAGHTESAIDQYQKALEVEPKNLQALLALARIYDNMGDRTEAIVYYKRAVKAHERSATAHNDLGLCYLRDGKVKESIASLKQAIELEPTKPLYRNNLAKILVENDRADEAYKVLVGVHGEAIAHYNIGFMLNERGQKAQALEHFRTASKVDPTLKVAQHWVNVLSPGEGRTQIAATTPAASNNAVPKSTVPYAPIAAPITPPATAAAAPSAVGPRYSQISTPSTITRADALAATAAASTASPDGPPVGSTEITQSGAASVLAAARAVAASPLSGGPDNAVRSKVVPLKTVAVPTSTAPTAPAFTATANPSLETPIESPIVVPGRAAPQSSVDARARYSNELPATGGSAQGPITLPSVTQPVNTQPATTPLPAPDAEDDGPRLGKKQRTNDANLVGDRYATGSRYATGNGTPAATVAARPTPPTAAAPIQPPRGAVPPLPEQFSRSTGGLETGVAKKDPKGTEEPASRPATAQRYPASRY